MSMLSHFDQQERVYRESVGDPNAPKESADSMWSEPATKPGKILYKIYIQILVISICPVMQIISRSIRPVF